MKRMIIAIALLALAGCASSSHEITHSCYDDAYGRGCDTHITEESTTGFDSDGVLDFILGAGLIIATAAMVGGM